MDKPGLAQMPDRRYVIALICYLAIPAVVLGGAALSRSIDPELARFSADYARNFQLLEMAAKGAALAAAACAFALWVATCYLVLKSRGRSALWLPLAAGGPIGFVFIAMLSDHAAAPADLYQRFVRRLQLHWRVALEIALFFSAWILAFLCVALRRDLSIALESYRTGVPVETIVARYDASSGMYAFGELLEATYVLALLYLLLPVSFNLVGRFLERRGNAPRQESTPL